MLKNVLVCNDDDDDVDDAELVLEDEFVDELDDDDADDDDDDEYNDDTEDEDAANTDDGECSNVFLVSEEGEEEEMFAGCLTQRADSYSSCSLSMWELESVQR